MENNDKKVSRLVEELNGLRRERDLTVRMIDASPVGIIAVDRAGLIFFANDYARKVLGLKESDIRKTTFSFPELNITDFDGNPVAQDYMPFANVIMTGEPVFGIRFAIERKNSDTVYLSSNAMPMLDPSGQVDAAVITVENITERKQAEQEKARLEKRLLMAHRVESIGHLAGGVAHNLNNILSPVIGYTDMVLDELYAGDPLYSHINEIKVAAERATDLVRQLLAFGRKQAFKLRRLNLNQVVKDLESMLRQTIREDIEIRFALAPSIRYVKADLSQVQQIIVNLSLNACEAMPSGGKITIETKNVRIDQSQSDVHQDIKPGPHTMLTISDTGKGMDRETLSHVFEPFFTTKEIGQGTGLGLATVYGIVKQHGGHIRVESIQGQGSRFNIYLPQLPERGDHTPLPVSKTSDVGGNETILVVEDEESLLRFTCLVLTKMGYNVLEAADGNKAIDVANDYKSSIHLLLTDVVMPGMNGKELYEKLRLFCSDLKVLYTSGYPDDVIARHGILDRNEDLLQKPNTVDQLTQKVRRILDR